MADENGIGQSEFPPDLHDIIGVTLQRGVFRRIVRRKVRPARADVVEQDHAKITLEGARDLGPHMLVAAEAVGE